jgi:hypothetical protein
MRYRIIEKSYIIYIFQLLIPSFRLEITTDQNETEGRIKLFSFATLCSAARKN